MAKRTRTQVKQEDASTPSSSTRVTRALRSVKEETSSPLPNGSATKKLARRALKKSVSPSPPLKTEIKEDPDTAIKDEIASPPPSKKAKVLSPDATASLQARKLKSYATTLNNTPFPTLASPTPSEAELAHSILTSIHGARVRPSAPPVAPKNSAGCGNSPSVLDALVRTILSQNTSDTNSRAAKLSMDAVYGRSDDWDAIVQGGTPKLEAAIRCGGLSAVKSKVIIRILEQVHAQQGEYSLEHLRALPTDEAHRELIGFGGVGPKTAACVELFCLGRESMAVDTHVWRLSGILGWKPPSAGREATQAHLEARVPPELKYGLHVLMVTHGKRCDECKAGGKGRGKCKLRKAFGKGKGVKAEDEEDQVKAEVREEQIKAEHEEDDDDDDDAEAEVKGERVKVEPELENSRARAQSKSKKPKAKSKPAKVKPEKKNNKVKAETKNVKTEAGVENDDLKLEVKDEADVEMEDK